MPADYIRISPEELTQTFKRILLRIGFPDQPAAICASVFTNNSVDGVYSHGVNRFPRFVAYTKDGHIIPGAKASCTHTAGAIEQWDGAQGSGPVNAFIATDRAMQLADKYGLGCVAMANTNHWMRGGTYGWRVAKAGYVAINWTNTIANTPAYGALDSKLGNNPLVVAVPFEGEAIVLDMALSQFSYGAMENYELKNEPLPVPGGYDRQGNISTDPKEIKLSGRALPIGHWKGAGLSLMLDILGVMLTGGRSVAQITAQGTEIGVSQVFIAFNISRLPNASAMAGAVRTIIDDFHQSKTGSNVAVRYPGEKALATRRDNEKNGVPVLQAVWKEILEL